ncbi:vWA domain-containing protein [Pseudomarimonas arenosa]|uniref:VWA domain-containing protein n=1 Tax=Pseudomarimonas arenosa TaxID=2774145 RepID=A0AAW3ZJZ9_9GAMM|nr:VWA domain-containing protein [Pseudomarimonas arenosa]MBD8525029.1 VWA domain-containing protein [Pseudomarimonas arenosa]
MISLLWPWLLIVLPLPWLASRWLPPAKGAQRWVLPWVLGTADNLVGQGSEPKIGASRQPWLAWLAWCALCLAVAQPVRYDELKSLQTTGRDLMLAVDISESMGTADMRVAGRRVDRLSAVQAVLGDFIERRAGDRLGLILFGQRAYLVTPLTLDRDSVRYQLETSAIGLAGNYTAIGDALALAVKRLHDRPESQRIVLLLTDGTNTAGELSPDRATQLAVELGVRVYTIGFGGEGNQDYFGLVLGPRGPEIDEQSLQSIAAATGGQYFRARDVNELAGIYQALDALEPLEFDAPDVQLQRPLFHYPLALSVLCMLAALWPQGRRPRTAPSAEWQP